MEGNYFDSDHVKSFQADQQNSSKNHRKTLLWFLPVEYALHAIIFIFLTIYSRKIDGPVEEEALREISLSDPFYTIFFARADNFSDKGGEKKF